MAGDAVRRAAHDTAAAVRARLDGDLDSIWRQLDELVRIESPSDDARCLEELAERLEQLFQPLGAVARHQSGAGGAPHLVVDVPGQDEALPHALVLGHIDTVWPRGTIERIPSALDDRGIVTGPGCFDMKGGLVLLLEALRALMALGSPPRRNLRVVLNSDEELGSPTSRPLIEASAEGAGVGFVLEPPLPDGGLKTSRKGSLVYRVEVEGRAAHPGIEPEKGVNAIVELSHHILRLHDLNDAEDETVVNVGTSSGGSRLNVVPADAAADVHARVWTAAAAERVDRAIKGLRPVDPRAVVRVIPGRTRPPMQPTPESEALFGVACDIASALGEHLTQGATGGGSDANLLAARGIPVLDGLGPHGGGAHADDEHVVLASMPYRGALLAGLLVGV